jgi:YD repeat-containing protein
MLRKRTLIALIFLFILGFASPLRAQSGASIQYGYDALGRLTQVMDPSGNVATTITTLPATYSRSRASHFLPK